MKNVGKSSLVVTKIGEVTEKGNVTLSLAQTKKGFKGANCYILITEDNLKEMEIAEGDDILELVGAYSVRESVWVNSDGEEQMSYWVEVK